jgi:hypothetical protein
MFSRRLREAEATIETLRTERRTQQEAVQDRKVRYARGALSTIRSAIKDGYPKCPQLPFGVEEFKSLPDRLRLRERDRINFLAANLKDGVALDFFTPHDFLELGKHSLIVPNRGEPEYSRRTVRYDIQKCPTPYVGVVGVEAIADVEYIQETLGFCLGAIAVERSHGWQNAYRLE